MRFPTHLGRQKKSASAGDLAESAFDAALKGGGRGGLVDTVLSESGVRLLRNINVVAAVAISIEIAINVLIHEVVSPAAWMEFALSCTIVWLLRTGNARLGAVLTLWGGAVAAACSGLFVGGMQAPGLVGFPVLAMLTGWLLGTRSAMLFVTVTSVFMATLMFAQTHGWLPALKIRQPETWMMAYIGCAAVGAVFGVAMANGVREQFAKANALRDSLREANDRLEEKVTLRTTELSESVQALRVAKDAAEAASRAKSAFVSNMSHEIRNPLNAITGMAMVLRQSGLDERQRRHLDRLELAAGHLMDLLNAVLDLSKIESGKLPLQQEPVDVGAVVSEVFDMLVDQARDKGIELSIDSGVPVPLVEGDSTRLRQALINYAANAVKFTDSGRIVLRTRWREMPQGKVRVRFEVEDTGPGIAAADLERLFKPFEQIDSSLSRRTGGSGLGLSITRLLAQAMGGDAGAASTPGRGSTFWFEVELPRSWSESRSAHREAKDALSSAYTRTAGPRILIADDIEVNRDIVAAMLAGLSPQYELAKNGYEAIELVHRQPFDLIFTDVQMPGMDGIEATRLIRKHPNGQHVPIVAMTGNAFSEEHERCLAAGANDVILKPIRPAQVMQVALRLLHPAVEP